MYKHGRITRHAVADHPFLKNEIEVQSLNNDKLPIKRRPKEDLIGKTFGRLTVIGIDDEIKKERIYWKCQCCCEDKNYISASTSALKSGRVRSCGCLRREIASNRLKKYNVYDLSNDFGVGYTTNTNQPFLFDKEDFELIKNYAWRTQGNGYIVSTNAEHATVYLHKLVMTTTECLEVDHINLDKLDNRKENLRVCTRQQNACNRCAPKNNTSGYPGVLWEKRFNKWRARIISNKHDYHLGLFDNYNDAVKARKEAEIKFHGDYRYKGD